MLPTRAGLSTANAQEQSKGLRRMKRALITGVTGQDGAYLSQFLLQKGLPVPKWLTRRSALEVPFVKA